MVFYKDISNTKKYYNDLNEKLNKFNENDIDFLKSKIKDEIFEFSFIIKVFYQNFEKHYLKFYDLYNNYFPYDYKVRDYYTNSFYLDG